MEALLVSVYSVSNDLFFLGSISYLKGELFSEAEQLADDATDDDDETYEAKKPAAKHSCSRKGLSDKLPRIQIHLDLSEEEKAGAINTFYSKVKEALDIIPAQVRMLEYLQENAVFQKDGQQIIKAAERASHPLGVCRT